MKVDSLRRLAPLKIVAARPSPALRTSTSASLGSTGKVLGKERTSTGSRKVGIIGSAVARAPKMASIRVQAFIVADVLKARLVCQADVLML